MRPKKSDPLDVYVDLCGLVIVVAVFVVIAR